MRSALPATLPRLRRILVLSCVALGFAAGAMTGGAGAALCGLGALGVLVGRLRRSSPGATALSRWRFANAALLAGCVLAAVLGAPGLPVAMTLVCWLLVHRAFSGDGAGDDRVSLLLTLLLVLLACILTTRPLLGPLFALLALLGPASLLLCTLEVELGEGPGVEAGDGRGLGGLWALPPVALVLSAAFFVLLPRVQRTDRDGDGSAQTLAGFDEDVELGALGPILDNPDAVLRARVTDGLGQPISGPFYFRGVALDHFDGRRWQGSLGGRVDPGVPGRPDADPSTWLLQQITLEPVAEGVLFGLAPIWSVQGAGKGLTVDTSGTWRGLDEGRARSYEVLSLHPERGASALRAGGGDPWRVARGRNERAALRAGLWTDLPPGLDPRIPPLADELARQAGEGAGPLQRARHAADWLRGNYRYSTVPDAQRARQPLPAFLFESRAGHCEYFATALAVLLRAQGLPTRLVNGFHGGEYNELGGFWVLRQRDAHSWVEVYIGDGDGEGAWVLLDATPSADDEARRAGLIRQLGDWLEDAWDRGVLRYDMDRQFALGLSGIAAARSVVAVAPQAPGSLGTGWLAGIGALGLLLAFAWVLRQLLRFLGGARRSRPAPGVVERQWRAARRLVHRRGWRLPEALPPVEAARWLRRQAGDAAEELETLAWLLYRVRYAGEPDANHARAARRARAALARLPRRRRAPGST